MELRDQLKRFGYENFAEVFGKCSGDFDTVEVFLNSTHWIGK